MYYMILSAAIAYGPSLALISAVIIILNIVVNAFRGG